MAGWIHESVQAGGREEGGEHESVWAGWREEGSMRVCRQGGERERRGEWHGDGKGSIPQLWAALGSFAASHFKGKARKCPAPTN